MASSSSSSAPSRWRSSGARRSSASSSASTSSTRSSSRALIYPIASHWVFGGGWLQVNVGMQDFAGSTAVHLIGATGALAALLLLGPRKGKYGPDGKPRAIPGHNMPLFGLGVLILWLGWFGFNPGSTLNALDGRFAEVVVVTNLAAARRRPRRARSRRYLKTKTIDIGMAGNGAIARARRDHGALGLRGAVGGARHRRRRRRHRRARRLRDRQEARRPGRARCRARPGRHLGHARVRPLHATRPGGVQRRRRRRPLLHRLVHAARRPGARRRGRVRVRVRPVATSTFWVDQEDLRPARHRRGGGRRPRHLRARHVRLPGAVHPGAGAGRLRCGRPVAAAAPTSAPTRRPEEVPA